PIKITPIPKETNCSAKAVLILGCRMVRSASWMKDVGSKTVVIPNSVQIPQATERTRKSEPADHTIFSGHDPNVAFMKSLEKPKLKAIKPVASVISSLVFSCTKANAFSRKSILIKWIDWARFRLARVNICLVIFIGGWHRPFDHRR